MQSSNKAPAGFIDSITANRITGWYIPSGGVVPGNLDFYADGQLVNSVTASGDRPDVRAAGFIESQCGFVADFPENTKKIDIVDADRNEYVWSIDVSSRCALNNLLNGEHIVDPQIAVTDDSNTQNKISDDDLNLLFDVSDLVYYIGHHDNLTGIQRVQSCIIQAIANTKTIRKSGMQFIAFNSDIRKFQIIDDRSFLNLLCDLSLPNDERQIKFDKISARNGHIFSRGDIKLDSYMNKKYTVVLLGAAWVILDYAFHIIELKRQYKIRFVAMFHDLIPIYARETCDQGTAEVFSAFISQIIEHVDVALSVSESTKKDLSKFCTDNEVRTPPIVVTRNGSSFEEFFKIKEHSSFERVPRDDHAKQSYVLCVSTIERRKNHEYIFEIWRHLIKKRIKVPRVICVGRIGWRSEGFLEALIKSNNLNGHFELVANISDTQLKALYQNCEFTIYPSLYEGWGLPVGESLNYGKVCVTTKSSSLPEVAGRWGTYIPLNDAETAADIISDLVENPDRIAGLADDIRSTFTPISWSEVAERVLDGCRLATSQPQRNDIPVWNLGREYTFRHLRSDLAGLIGEELLASVHQASQGSIWEKPIGTAERISGLEARCGHWYAPEAWGCWSSGPVARLRFALDRASQLHSSPQNLQMYVAVQLPPKYIPCSLSLSIAGHDLHRPVQIPSGQAIVRWVIPGDLIPRICSKSADSDVFNCQFTINKMKGDIVEVVDEEETRDLGLGMRSVLILPEADVQSRLSILERMLFR